MKERSARRTFWCLLTFPASAAIAVVSLLLRSFTGIPGAEPSAWAEIVASPIYVPSQYAYAVAYVLPFLGFLSLYNTIRDQGRGEVLGFWGLVGVLAGTALALPTLGLLAFAGPTLAELFLAGNADMPQILNDIALGPAMGVGLPAAVLYLTGCVLLGIAIWVGANLPKWSGIALALHGITLVFGFGSPVALVASWVLLAACGVALIVRVGHQETRASKMTVLP